MLPSELEEYFISIGQPKFRAKQMFPKLAEGMPISEMTDLPKALREKLLSETTDTLLSY